MNSSQMQKESLILKLYQTKETVFTIKEIALLCGGDKRENLRSKINYYIKNKRLRQIRRGIYAKPEYDSIELAAKIFAPAYISLETVLGQEGIIFQYYKTIFVVSYLTRRINIDGSEIQYRKVKQGILLNKQGIDQQESYAKAIKERAFLDALYLYKNYYFDNTDGLDQDKIFALLKIYQSKKLTERAQDVFKNAEHPKA